MSGLIIFGTFVDAPSPTDLRIRENHICVVDKNGIIVRLEGPSGISEDELLNQLKAEHSDTQWTTIPLRGEGREVVCPGLIDCHIHAPQYPQLGTKTDIPLMRWLAEYTFPAEARFASPAHARKHYPNLVRRLLRNGTTSAMYYGSTHLEATKILADTCAEMGQRAWVGKNCSDGELCPEYYRETTEAGVEDTRRFIEYCHERYGREGLVRPVVTPRFTPTCTPALLEGLGKLAQEHDVAIQTHASETVDEVSLVAQLFPSTPRDVPLLKQSGLLTHRTVLAHGCHLTNPEAHELANLNVGVAACPYSNILFSQAVLPVARFQALGLKIGLGTDIAGGWTPSLWQNIRLAVLQDRVESFTKVGTHLLPGPQSEMGGMWEVTWVYALHLATVGGARCLNMDSDNGGIGLLEVGRRFDALKISFDLRDQAFEFYEEEGVKDRFEKFVLGGDERNIGTAWVEGREVHSRDTRGLVE